MTDLSGKVADKSATGRQKRQLLDRAGNAGRHSDPEIRRRLAPADDSATRSIAFTENPANRFGVSPTEASRNLVRAELASVEVLWADASQRCNGPPFAMVAMESASTYAKTRAGGLSPTSVINGFY
ncbi:hypothetical protein Mal15_18090 [Stieleria maiorica]|uniref:Uncharacterized protein n=1 Tax=Stieleria maiorica TaxID=2795974 RepID=A0A5B9ME47_9BACT|nr:hypothetical protein [Stieleria maiorica]QEF97765.1 hypothetical protein Mal15_18090 [Stieleria maiorica]